MPGELEPEGLDYRVIDPPWFYDGQNVYLRAFRLHEVLSEMKEAIDTLVEFTEHVEEDINSTTHSMVREVHGAIHDLIEGTEEFQWEFPYLASERWFGTTQDDIEHAFWKMEEGRFRGAHEDPIF